MDRIERERDSQKMGLIENLGKSCFLKKAKANLLIEMEEGPRQGKVRSFFGCESCWVWILLPEHTEAWANLPHL